MPLVHPIVRPLFLATALAVCLLLSAPAGAQIPGDVTLDSAFGGASFSTPVALRNAGDGSDRKFVVERSGRIDLTR